MQQIIEQARAARIKAVSLSAALTEAYDVIAEHDKSLDALLCKKGMQELLESAPELDALALKRSPETAKRVPETAKSITDAVRAYINGDIKAVRVSREHACNDANGNKHDKASFRFLSEHGQVDVVITVVKVRSFEGYSYELVDTEKSHWFHFKGQPVSNEERETLKKMFQQAALGVTSEDISFVNKPEVNELEAALQLVDKLAPVLAEIEI